MSNPAAPAARRRGRPPGGGRRPDQRNPSLLNSAEIRCQLADELPELPRELADGADVYALSILVLILMRPLTSDRDAQAQTAH